ncbi:hypothetical protein [Paraburkholderia sediminicola]|uniref:hypothetical protein n=1 Tax=Paraburkholderia sediminicola TaxID=458836 RepID=UPI0038B92DE4
MSTVKSAARPEQSKQLPLNLASLPRDEALERARVAGRGILVDDTAVSAVFLSLWTDWMNANIPNACGQSEGEFGDLVNSMMEMFEAGVNEFIRAATFNPMLERVESLLADDSSRAWKIHNVLAFMVLALPDDTTESLPVRCTLVELREDMKNLAANLMDLVWRARHD